MRTRILVKHSKKCLGLEQVRLGHWVTPWYFPTNHTDPLPRDRLGRSWPSGRKWFRAECNDTECPAVMIVAPDSILAEAHLNTLRVAAGY